MSLLHEASAEAVTEYEDGGTHIESGVTSVFLLLLFAFADSLNCWATGDACSERLKSPRTSGSTEDRGKRITVEQAILVIASNTRSEHSVDGFMVLNVGKPFLAPGTDAPKSIL